MIQKPKEACCVVFSIILLLLIMPLCSMSVHGQGDASEVSVQMQLGSIQATINEAPHELNQPPLIINGRSMVPLTFFSEGLGADIQWNGENRSILYQNDSFTVLLSIDQRTAYVNEQPVTLDAAPVIVNDRTMVPVRFISDILGYEVSWDAATQTITIVGVGSFKNSQVSDQQPEKPQKHPLMALEVFRLVNEERAKEGIQPLRLNDPLMIVAETKSRDMVEELYFSHTSPVYGDMGSLLDTFQIDYRYAGENIATGQPTAEVVMQAWMSSPSHRANILNPRFNQIGIGTVQGGLYGGTTWTQTFTD